MSYDPIFSVEKKNIVVTGACGLIGSEIAKAFIERGAIVHMVDIAKSDPVAQAKSLAPTAYGYAIDVSKSGEVAALKKEVVGRRRKVEVLINCHQYKPKGFLEAQPENFPEELWDDIINVNLKGTFLMCREFGTHMLENKNGSIINFASTYGLVSSNPSLYDNNSMGNPLAYSASKGGVIMLTKYLGVYWASKGVRVNCITPHGVWNHHEKAFEDRFSYLSPMGRMMKSDEIIGAILFLASDASSYSTGSNILVEGGWTSW